MASLNNRSDRSLRKPLAAAPALPRARHADVAAKRRVPRGDVRRRELANIAEEVFLESGFADTTMQMIASRAGASKETLYRHFASKEALFAEIMKERATALAGPDSALARRQTPRKALGELGLNLLRMMIYGKAPSMFRVVLAETPRTPALGALFYSAGPGAILERLTEYLRVETARGELRCRRPAQAARLFLGAVMANHHLLVLVAPPEKPITDRDLHAHVRAAVALFLARYGKGPGHARSQVRR
jgi:TetR/AcrR family transcriptional regulator, mexJK operon transcriptional repressor